MLQNSYTYILPQYRDNFEVIDALIGEPNAMFIFPFLWTGVNSSRDEFISRKKNLLLKVNPV